MEKRHPKKKSGTDKKPARHGAEKPKRNAASGTSKRSSKKPYSKDEKPKRFSPDFDKKELKDSISSGKVKRTSKRASQADKDSKRFSTFYDDKRPSAPAGGERPARFSKKTDSQNKRLRPTDATKQDHPFSPAAKVMEEAMRLNKFVAHCGICARRQAAEYVKKGLVKVNGQVELNPSYLVQPADKVEYKGKPIQLEENKVYILMNKPKDVITTSSDEKGRKTVLEIVGKKVPERIFPVGRLDRMTTGLLLLTNDGDLAKKLSHPSYKVAKFYHVTLDKIVGKDDIDRIKKGLNLEDGIAQVDGIEYVGEKKDEVGIEIHIGKNRIIRRIFEYLGYEVLRLDRTYYAGLNKKDIGRGHFRHLTEQEVIMLKHFK